MDIAEKPHNSHPVKEKHVIQKTVKGTGLGN